MLSAFLYFSASLLIKQQKFYHHGLLNELQANKAIHILTLREPTKFLLISQFSSSDVGLKSPLPLKSNDGNVTSHFTGLTDF
jgi:hypothetical protein